MLQMRSLVLLLSAVIPVVVSTVCPAQTMQCVRGAGANALDQYGFIYRDAASNLLLHPVGPMDESTYCVLAFTIDCQISAYGTNTLVGNIPPGTCGAGVDSSGTQRVFCVCNDAHNCNNDYTRWQPLAAGAYARMNFVLDCPSTVNVPVAGVPQKSPCVVEKKPDGAGQTGLWTGIASLAALASL